MHYEWNVACFEIDKTSSFAEKFLSTKLKLQIQRIFPARTDKLPVSTKEYITELTSGIDKLEGKVLTIYGSGSFHHYTYGLIRNLADVRSKKYTYVHIDQHTDDASPQAEHLGCGSFVGQLNKPPVEAIRYIGCEQILSVFTQKEFVLNNQTINEKGVQKSLQDILAGTPDDVYVSIDLDVLNKNEMLTRWAEGKMSIDTLLQIIDYLKNNKNIISADVLGHGSYFIPLKGDLKTSDEIKGKINHTNMLVYAMVVGTFLGQNIERFKEEHTSLASQDLHKYLNQ
ncbi:arginase family protein [Candidatus Woesearchaeota archaeon]|nr:arginase family protein [Candidatus Woesearchaeota archaeon]